MKASERKLVQELLQIMETSIEFGNLYQKYHGLEKSDTEKLVREKKKELFNLIKKSRELGEYYQSTGKEFPNLN